MDWSGSGLVHTRNMMRLCTICHSEPTIQRDHRDQLRAGHANLVFSCGLLDLQQVPSHDQVPGEVRTYRVRPHFIFNKWIPARYEMGKD